MGGKTLARQALEEANALEGRGEEGAFSLRFCARAHDMALVGANDAEIAEAFNVTQATLIYWKLNHPEFAKAMSKAREKADVKVVKSAYRRAIGYTLKDVQVKKNADGQVVETIEKKRHFPASDTMIQFWLTNRQGARWKVKDSPVADTLDLVEMIKAAMKQPGDDARVIDVSPERPPKSDD